MVNFAMFKVHLGNGAGRSHKKIWLNSKWEILVLCDFGTYANIIAPDERPCSVASYLGLC